MRTDDTAEIIGLPITDDHARATAALTDLAEQATRELCAWDRRHGHDAPADVRAHAETAQRVLYDLAYRVEALAKLVDVEIEAFDRDGIARLTAALNTPGGER